jgi:ankyrin repeat protein
MMKNGMVLGTIRRFFLLWMIIAFGLVFSSCKGKVDGPDRETGKKAATYTEEDFLRAVQSGNTEKVDLFIREGIDVNVRDKGGYTALLIASEQGDPAMARLLIDKGADVNAKDKDGYTPLMYVAYSGNSEIAKMLIKNRAEIHARDKDGWTAGMIARIQKKAEIIELLKEAAAKK